MSDSDCKHDELKRTSDVTDDGALIQPTDVALRNRITSYLANNESLKPEQVSDLLRDCRRGLAAQASSDPAKALNSLIDEFYEYAHTRSNVSHVVGEELCVFSEQLRVAVRALVAQALAAQQPTDGALRASVIDWKARFDELSAEFAILSRACGNWRTWPNEVESDHDHPDWKVAAKAILTVRALAAQASSDPLDKASFGAVSGDRIRALLARWRVYANAMMNQPDREMNIAAAAQQTCADELEILSKGAPATPDTAPMGGQRAAQEEK